ncbi:MAG: radical SAM protein [Patescibacteria group bacterium]
MIKIALATAHVLGLKKTKIEDKSLPSTAHFMTTGRCVYDCSFCTQARSAKLDDQYLSRIIWPEFEKDKIKEILREKLDKKFKRICLQVTQSPGYLEKTLEFLEYIKKLSHLPLSVSIRPRNLKEVQLLFKKGVSRLGLALDVVDEIDYQKIKKGNYQEFLKFLLKAGKQFPGKITTHLIIGFSETEKQVIELIKKLHQNRLTMALFALTPIQGTALAKQKPPKLVKYRRVQLAQFLITGHWRCDLRFNKQGELRSVGWKKKDLLEKLYGTNLFQTSGCSGCNRPYYNEKPSGMLYNYPYKLSKNEFRQAINELNLETK